MWQLWTSPSSSDAFLAPAKVWSMELFVLLTSAHKVWDSRHSLTTKGQIHTHSNTHTLRQVSTNAPLKTQPWELRKKQEEGCLFYCAACFSFLLEKGVKGTESLIRQTENNKKKKKKPKLWGSPGPYTIRFMLRIKADSGNWIHEIKIRSRSPGRMLASGVSDFLQPGAFHFVERLMWCFMTDLRKLGTDCPWHLI